MDQVKQRTLKHEKVQRVQEQLKKETKMKTAIEEMLQLYSRDPQASRDAQLQLDGIQQRISQLSKQLQSLQQERSKASISTQAVGDLQQLAQQIMQEQGQRRLDLANVFGNSLKLAKFNVEDVVMALLQDKYSELRAAGYRIARLAQYQGTLFDVQVVKSLLRLDGVEKEQALMYVRGIRVVPAAIASVVVAIAEQQDDPFSLIALETLCEWALLQTSLTASCGGFKVLFGCFLEGSRQQVDLVLPVILHCIDAKETRAYIRPSVELEVVISGFTDAYFQKNDPKKTDFIACCRVVASLLKSWNGLFYLCGCQQDQMWSIKFLVDALALPYDETRKVVLDLLIETFRIEIPKWLTDVIQARGGKLPFLEPPKDLPLNQLASHHAAMLLTIFLDSNLLQTLMETVEASSNKLIVLKTIILLRELLHICHQYLCPAKVKGIYQMSKLFKISTLFNSEDVRIQATTAVEHIDKGYAYDRDDSGDDEVELRVLVANDDNTLKQMLTDSQVLTAKDHTTWDWDVIVLLLEGPLQSIHKLEEVLKTTLFFKKLLSYFRPESRKFSDLKQGKGNAKYSQAMLLCFQVLLGCQEGIKFIADNKFLASLTLCFDQLDPINNSLDEIQFTQERLQTTLTQDYFYIFGLLCKDQDGLELLTKFNLFDRFYKMSELKSRDDIMRLLLVSMDYSFEGHPRIILQKILTSGNKSLRMFATSHLQNVFRELKGDFTWAVQMLITQLYDPVLSISEKAVVTLQETCQVEANLLTLISYQPRMDHIGSVVTPLLLRYLNCDSGFNHLKNIGYIDLEYESWVNAGNTKFGQEIELYMSRTQQPSVRTSTLVRGFDTKAAADLKQWNDEVKLRPHFLGKVAQTVAGCQYLREVGAVENLKDQITALMLLESLDEPHLQKFKGMLWAIGNIGSSKFGVQLLSEFDMIRLLTDLGQDSETLSVKATCLMCIGMISRTSYGAAQLMQYGFDSSPQGFALPQSWQKYTQVPCWKYKHVQLQQPQQEHFSGFEGTQLEIIKNIGNLSNHILASASSKALTKLKQDKPLYFQDFGFYCKVLKILSTYHYRLTARRFVSDLFDGVQDMPVKSKVEPVNE